MASVVTLEGIVSGLLLRDYHRVWLLSPGLILNRSTMTTLLRIPVLAIGSSAGGLATVAHGSMAVALWKELFFSTQGPWNTAVRGMHVRVPGCGQGTGWESLLCSPSFNGPQPSRAGLQRPWAACALALLPLRHVGAYHLPLVHGVFYV